jgi:hypothetical protein
MLFLNCTSISGINLEVEKIFALDFACKAKISVKSFVLQPLDVWHSSSASTTMKLLEYRAATDYRVLDNSLNAGRVRFFLWLS